MVYWEHTQKVTECVEVIRPLMEALVNEDYVEIRRLQDQVSRLEYEADVIKHEVREHLPRRYFLPVDRVELEKFIDEVAMQDLRVPVLRAVGVGRQQASNVLSLLDGLNEEEWKADRIARSLSKDIFALEDQLDPITLLFYEKMLLVLSEIANEAENAGDMLRTMIVK